MGTSLSFLVPLEGWQLGPGEVKPLPTATMSGRVSPRRGMSGGWGGGLWSFSKFSLRILQAQPVQRWLIFSGSPYPDNLMKAGRSQGQHTTEWASQLLATLGVNPQPGWERDRSCLQLSSWHLVGAQL